ncbi:ABC transporter ATP-binding protein [Novosphingobium sp. PASSN1]|uniref:ATP-binding cassette domain-containing protein n=1 Tax=Novosphingobium sp. PASSN1 TaxID=2015561 RepID=UPI0025E908CC|nr:ABC transporter ATP-binding protein [Novosphingobium sp. PASSN1]
MSLLPEAALWPTSALGEALEALALRHDLLPRADASEAPPPPPTGLDTDLTQWLVRAGARLGIEALPVSAAVRELPAFLRHGGPALVAIEGAFLALDGVRRGRPIALCRDGRRVALDAEALAARVAQPLAAALQPEVARVLGAAGIAQARREQVSAAMIAARIGAQAVKGLVLLRLPAHAPFLRQCRRAGLHWRLLQITALFALLYGADLWGWSLIGGATLSGKLDWGWFAAWALLAFTLLPVQLLAGWSEAVFALETGRLLKSRLLAGALAMPPDLVRRRGVGEMIGQIMEAQALEGLALGGAFAVLVGLIELVLAGLVLRAGAAPVLHPALLAITAVGCAGFGLRVHRSISGWTRQRLRMTHYLIEAMTGHRTRLAQERPARRDASEDTRLAGYLRSARTMDRTALGFGAGLSLGWSLAALLALAPAMASAAPPAPTALAISLGGMLLAQRALGGIGGGLTSLSRARFAWGQVGAIFRSGNRAPQSGAATIAPVASGGGPLLEARDLRYTHAGSHTPVLQGANLAIAHGDRILIEGPSGGGKSTLASLLTGLRQPDGGLLLLAGLDRPTIGDAWHSHVTAAPQFHENHILSGTFAFNLLMGRQWPASEADLAEAAGLCEELGLGDLLRRMPGGLHQRIGETGWQLSHGERSRVFLARALLQRAAVTILDESFASLDPATMDQCLRTALARSETLVVIAHP